MVKFNTFNPLNITRRSSVSRTPLPRYERVRPRATSSAAETYGGGQGGDSFDESDEYETDDSPVTNSTRSTESRLSEKPMLRRKRSSTDRSRPARNRMSHRIMRYLCLAMISTIALFIFSLIRMSHLSQKKLEIGNIGVRPPPPPAPWELFPFLKRYYGGIRTLVPLKDNTPEYPLSEDESSNFNGTAPEAIQAAIRAVPESQPFNPYPDYNSAAYLAEYEPVQECFIDAQNTIRVPRLQAYSGRTSGFPEHVMGSYEIFGFRDDVCFERYGRLGPYGHGYSLRSGGMSTGLHGDQEGNRGVWSERQEVDYRDIDWADVQTRCHQANAARFQTSSPYSTSKIDPLAISNKVVSEKDTGEGWKARSVKEPTGSTLSGRNTPAKTTKKKLSRTAVVVRTWDSYVYKEEDILYLRALMSELVLGSGGEYDLHLLVQVKNLDVPIWADAGTYEEHLHNAVPQEFWGIATLWSETQMLLLYHGLHDTYARGPGLPVHGVYRGLQMAIQNFAHNHPEYDFFWHWEMDIRYTGHFYHLFDKFTGWAKQQPRKGLWERNSRFYVPSVHGTWEDFKQMVRVQTEMGTDSPTNMWAPLKGKDAKVVKDADGNKLLDKSGKPVKPNTPEAVEAAKEKGDKPVWGPERPKDENDWFETENDPKPPTSYEKDKYSWGVGEEADLITLNPIFDPDGTTWGLAHDVTGYNTDQGLPNRRSVIVTASRMSARLLRTMHRETAFKKHHAFSEMWPAMAALQHGYKAVYVPHPMYVDREWPTQYLSSVMNAGKNGATGGARTSVFGDREHNLLGMTWYYNAGFAPNLWRRWLGFRVDNEGGEEFEMQGIVGQWAEGEGKKGGEGRMCLPPMLVHPIKGVELPVEEIQMGEKVPESDPTA